MIQPTHLLLKLVMMVVVAFPPAGDPKRLVYGLDSNGLLCGSNNTYKDTVMDLTDKPNLYYLEALELLDPTNLMYAKAVCVSECPSTDELCSLSNLPCTNNTQYRCAAGSHVWL